MQIERYIRKSTIRHINSDTIIIIHNHIVNIISGFAHVCAKAYCTSIYYVPITLISCWCCFFFLFGSIRILQTYMAPWLAVFVDPIDAESAMYNNFRVFGTGLLCIMGKFLFFSTVYGGLMHLNIINMNYVSLYNFYNQNNNNQMNWHQFCVHFLKEPSSLLASSLWINLQPLR